MTNEIYIFLNYDETFYWQKFSRFFFASSLATSQVVLNNLKIYVDTVFMFMHERENREI